MDIKNLDTIYKKVEVTLNPPVVKNGKVYKVKPNKTLTLYFDPTITDFVVKSLKKLRSKFRDWGHNISCFATHCSGHDIQDLEINSALSDNPQEAIALVPNSSSQMTIDDSIEKTMEPLIYTARYEKKEVSSDSVVGA